MGAHVRGHFGHDTGFCGGGCVIATSKGQREPRGHEYLPRNGVLLFMRFFLPFQMVFQAYQR